MALYIVFKYKVFFFSYYKTNRDLFSKMLIIGKTVRKKMTTWFMVEIIHFIFFLHFLKFNILS